MKLRHGSLCTGYGGIDLALAEVLNTETVWVSDIDKGACRVLAHRYPDVPNIGDMTAVDWSQVEPVDIISGGTPCQDLSHAGARKGMREGTRSNLWVSMREAIATIRPRLVVWENVRGAYSADADSEVEPCPGCVGDGSGRHLRALGRVLGDLADLGYDARWHGLRAADVGAPHGRFRVFVVAYPRGEHGLERWLAAPGQAEGGRALGEPAGRDRAPVALLGTPRTADGVYHNLREPDAIKGEGRGRLEDQVALLPTPRATDGTKGGPNKRGSSGDLMLPSAVQLLPTPTTRDEAAPGGSSPSDVTLTDAVVRTEMGTRDNPRLLPTPSVADAMGGHESRSGARSNELLLKGIAKYEQWGKYAAAIARWEHLTREAPAPTEPGRNGNPRLSPAFTEWLMGLPAGWITDVPGITRNEALRLAGNGCVPQQVVAALHLLLGMEVDV